MRRSRAGCTRQRETPLPSRSREAPRSRAAACRQFVNGALAPGGDVKALRGLPLARLATCRIPGARVVGDPRAPAVVADLRDGVEIRAERANPPRLVGPKARLVRGERRDG